MTQTSGLSALVGRWWLWLLLMAIALLLVLPELLRIAVVSVVARQGLGEAEISDIDLNLFKGTAAIKELRWRQDSMTVAARRIEADIHWPATFRESVRRGSLSWHGELSLDQLGLDYQTLTLHSRRLDWQGRIGGGQLAGDINTGTVELGDTSQGITMIQWQALAVEQLHLTDADTIRLSGLQIDQLELVNSAQLERPELRMGSLSLAGFSLVDRELNIEDVQVRATDHRLSFAPDGKLMLQHSVDQLSKALVSNVDPAADQPQDADTRAMVLRIGSLSMSDGNRLALHNLPNVDQVYTDKTYADKTIEVAQWQSLVVKQLQLLNPDSITLSQLQIDKLDLMALPGQSRPALRTANLILQDFSLADQKLAIAGLNLKDADYRLIRMPDGQLQPHKIFNALLAAVPPSVAPAKDNTTAPPLLFDLNQFSMTGNNRIELIDRSFKTPVQQALLIDKLEINAIRQSQPQQAGSLALVARFDEFSSLQLSGELKPFAEQPWAQLKGEISSLPLPAISPYSERYLGYRLDRGLYNHKLQLNIDNGQINLSNDLLLKKLKLKRAAENGNSPLDQLDISLPLALNMLRDGDDNITLKVPVSGSLEDPDISIGSVINLALGNALKKGATSYLKYMLQPYGAALLAAEAVGKRATRIGLDAINFVAGSAEPDRDNTGYYEKLTALMAKRRGLDLTLCGSSNGVDRESLPIAANSPDSQQALVELANKRALAIKKQLVERGVDSSRVLLCQGEYVENGRAQVSLGF